MSMLEMYTFVRIAHVLGASDVHIRTHRIRSRCIFYSYYVLLNRVVHFYYYL